MYVLLTCRCPRCHTVVVKHQLKGPDVNRQYINKELLEQKIPGYCYDCKEQTLLRVESMAEAPYQYTKRKPSGTLSPRDSLH